LIIGYWNLFGIWYLVIGILLFKTMGRQIDCHNLGLIDYRRAWEMQKELHARRANDEISDTLLLLEHPPVFTLGKRDCPEDIISSPDLIASDGIEIIKTERGGRITYHGPGQLVGYFICRVSEMGGIKRFVFLIEELLLRVLADYDVKGGRDPAHPGIWVGKNKIAAIGLHVSRNITQHGFALNVNPDLDHYRHIVPCGIRDRGVTSLERLLNEAPSINEIKEKISLKIQDVFIAYLK
jgi:lipoyl(octanoyl) transferase